MVPYPQAADAEAALAIVWSKVNGASVPFATLAQASWVIEGFGLSIGLPMVAAAAPAGDALASLKAMLSPHFSGKKPRALGDGTILKTIISDLPEILAALQAIMGMFGTPAPVAAS